MNRIANSFAKAKADGASDIHLVAGLPPKYRLSGDVVNMSETPLTEEDCVAVARYLCGVEYDNFDRIGEFDGADTFAGNRCRIHLFKQQGIPSLALRLLREEIPVLENLNLPPAVAPMVDLHKGIVLVTGETGSGKTAQIPQYFETSCFRRHPCIQGVR